MRLSVVVPAYNEEQMIISIIQILRERVLDADQDEIIVASDGSTDHTTEVAKNALGQFPGRVLALEHGGKGHALKQGMAGAHGDYVGMVDADCEYQPESLIPMLRKAERVHGLCVYRRDPDLRRFSEVVSSRASARLIRAVLPVGCSDPQAGLKVLPGGFARQAVALVSSDGWLFDSELLARASQAGIPLVEHRGPQIPARRRSAKPLEMVGLLPELMRLRSSLHAA